MAQARSIPDLLRWTQQYALSGDSPVRQRRVAVAAHAAVFFLRNLGELDLAVMAAERMASAARQSEDQATIGFAAFAQSHALAPAGAIHRAAAVAIEAADSTMGTLPEASAARGSCLLAAASASAAMGDFDRARALILTADELAEVLTVPTIVAGHTSFSRWNVTMYRVAVEVDAGNPCGWDDLLFSINEIWLVGPGGNPKNALALSPNM